MEQDDLLRILVETLRDLRIPYMVVGSLGSMAYGEPRMTQDIDVVVDLDARQVEELCNEFQAEDYYLSRDAARAAVQSRGQFNIIHSASGNKIDVILARNDAWGRTQMSRARREQLQPGLVGYVGAPEDIILGKMSYYREGGSEKHLRDIAGMLKVSGTKVDRDYIVKWAKELGLTEIWEAVLNRLGGGS